MTSCWPLYCTMSSFIGIIFLSVLGILVDQNQVSLTRKLNIITTDQKQKTVQNIFITVGLYGAVFAVSLFFYIMQQKNENINASLIERRNRSDYSNNQQELQNQ